MTHPVAAFYSGNNDLAATIAETLRGLGKDIDSLKTDDLMVVDEFHIRGRQATLELADRMNLDDTSEVLDIGCGLGGPARTVAETYGCRVTGIDLTPAFCKAGNMMSDWVDLSDRVSLDVGDATDLPFANDRFDAAMTIHAAMNIPAKDLMYAEARRVVRPGAIFAVYDVVQGEGGDVIYPVPWAAEPSISALATLNEMKALLSAAGFTLLDVQDSTEESQAFFERMTARMAETGEPPVVWRAFLGDRFGEMVRNQVRNVTDRRIRTVTFICRA